MWWARPSRSTINPSKFWACWGLDSRASTSVGMAIFTCRSARTKSFAAKTHYWMNAGRGGCVSSAARNPAFP